MASLPKFARPTFEQSLEVWRKLLDDRNLPTELVWIYDENLVFERDGESGFRLGYQTHFTPPPPEAERITFDYFCEFEARMAYYRLGSNRGRSVCLMLCDVWFEGKDETDGYVRKDDWLMSFHPGTGNEIEEIRDEERWRNRIVRNRPLHDLDFCMTLRGVHEMLAHGRVLTTYEHCALKLLGAWRRILREQR